LGRDCGVEGAVKFLAALLYVVDELTRVAAPIPGLRVPVEAVVDVDVVDLFLLILARIHLEVQHHLHMLFLATPLIGDLRCHTRYRLIHFCFDFSIVY